MPVLWYAVFIVALGVLAIAKWNNLRVRRAVILIYCALMGLFAFGMFVAGPRIGLSAVKSAGLPWTPEARQVVEATLSAYSSLWSLLFLIALVLAMLALRPPK